MPVGSPTLDNPAAGYAVYSAVKLVGYSAFALYIQRFYHTNLARAVHFGASGEIAEDLLCSKCEYLLTGLSPKLNCPECGLAVSATLGDPYLKRPGVPHANFLLVGFVRTLIGMALGYAYYGLMHLIPGWPAAAVVVFLIPIRLGEWALLLFVFYDRKWRLPPINERIILRGVLVSFLLDLPAMYGFCLMSLDLNIC